MTNKEEVLGSFDKNTLTYSAGAVPVYTKEELQGFSKFAACVAYEDDKNKSNWVESWYYYSIGEKEYCFIPGFGARSESIPVKKVLFKASYSKDNLPENESFKLVYCDNTTVFEESFRWDNTTGGILSSSANSQGVELKIHIPYNTSFVQIYRMTPGASKYSYYSSIHDDYVYDSVSNTGSYKTLSSMYAVFTDPYVTVGEEYSYKISFVTPNGKYSDFTEPVTVSPSAGKGEVKLLNEPAGSLDKPNKQFVFTTLPEFTSLESVSVSPNLVIEYKKPEWTAWGNAAYVFNGNKASYKYLVEQFDKLSVKLGVAGEISGTCLVGFGSKSINYVTSEYFYPLENTSFEWSRVVDIGDNGTSFTKTETGNEYNFSFSGSGKYDGLYISEETDEKTGKISTIGMFFIKQAELPIAILDSNMKFEKKYGSSTVDMSCMVRLEKQSDGSWLFLGYEFLSEMADQLTYNEVSDSWSVGGTVYNRSSLTSITAGAGIFDEETYILVPAASN